MSRLFKVQTNTLSVFSLVGIMVFKYNPEYKAPLIANGYSDIVEVWKENLSELHL